MTLKEIEARLAAIKQDMDAEGADIEALSKEVDSLIEERNKIIAANESRSKLLAKIASGELGAADNGIGGNDGGIIGITGDTAEEKRAKVFAAENKITLSSAESRALLVSSGDLATPTKVTDIQDLKHSVSSIVDMVWIEDCNGMSADNVAYIKSESEASDGTEGVAATESIGTMGVVSITPKLHNLASYVSNEIKNQTPLNYTSKVQAQAFKALRRKAAKVITDAVIGSEIAKEITDISAIDDKTLRKITLNHGSDEDIEGGAVLFLNKKDLIAFGDVRGSDKKAVYEITADKDNTNTGIIKDGGLSVRYCLNSNCTALTGSVNSSTTKTMPTMFYGNPKCAKLDLFGPYTVRTSEDYKFAEGLLAILGTMSIGAGMVVKDGFTIVSLPKKSG